MTCHKFGKHGKLFNYFIREYTVSSENKQDTTYLRREHQYLS
jgi:hypothetical protein